MDPPETEESRLAIDHLIRAIDETLTGVALMPGECLFIDNYKTVHGRDSFKARFDGTDRWLKRIDITRDLRKSPSAQSSRQLTYNNFTVRRRIGDSLLAPSNTLMPCYITL
jgi:hypothetical protein